MYGVRGWEESACWVLNNKTINNIHVGNAIISVGGKVPICRNQYQHFQLLDFKLSLREINTKFMFALTDQNLTLGS